MSNSTLKCGDKHWFLVKYAGVYTVNIDSQQNKVTVTGNIDSQTLLKKLVKAGKHAEIWPTTTNHEEKSPPQKNKKGKSNKEKNPQNSEEDEETEEDQNSESFPNHNKNIINGANVGQVVKFVDVDSKSHGKPPVATEISPANNQNSGGGHGSKKKKRRGRKSNNSKNGNVPVPVSADVVVPSSTGTGMENHNQVQDQIILSPSYQPPTNLYHPLYQSSYVGPDFHHQGHVVSYNAAYSSASPVNYYVPSSYTVPELLPEVYYYSENPSSSSSSSALTSFEILSDENPNGCYIMWEWSFHGNLGFEMRMVKVNYEG